MRTIIFTASFLVLTTTSLGFAGEEKYASPTFADILKRVTSRHKGSGAILLVRAKRDSPRPDFHLHFWISAGGSDNVTIRLYGPIMGRSLYEHYVLKIDDALRKELANQKRMVAIKKAERKKWVARQKEHIRKVSAGKLRFGMLYKEVEKVMGKPDRTFFGSPIPGYGSAIWGNRLYCFEVGLTDILEINTKKPDPILPGVPPPPGTAP